MTMQNSQELHACMASVGEPAQARLSQLTRYWHQSWGARSHGHFHKAAIAIAADQCTTEALGLCTVKRCAVSSAASEVEQGRERKAAPPCSVAHSTHSRLRAWHSMSYFHATSCRQPPAAAGVHRGIALIDYYNCRFRNVE